MSTLPIQEGEYDLDAAARAPLSFKELSAFNAPKSDLLVVALKAYFDGSGKADDPRCTHITLGGYVATPDAWDEFEPRWAGVLERWSCDYLHMSDAKKLVGNFSPTKGWTDERVTGLLKDLFNECLSPLGWKSPSIFRGIYCTVPLIDFRRFCNDFSDSRYRRDGVEALCVDVVISYALAMLPEDMKASHGKRGTIELFFDRGEKFLHKINRVWERKRKKGYFRHIAHIGPVDMDRTYGVQAADFLVWHANKGFSRDDLGAQIMTIAAAKTYRRHLDYHKLADLHFRRLEQGKGDRPQQN